MKYFKKIFLIINTIILCLVSVSCSEEKDEILYKDEVLEFIFTRTFYETYSTGEFITKQNYFYLFDTYKMNKSHEFYEATLLEKKVIAGYYDDKTINKLVKFSKDQKIEGLIYSDLYKITTWGTGFIYGLIYNSYREYPSIFNFDDYEPYVYTFDDKIPFEYNNKKLGFVLNYYVLVLNDGRKIVCVGECNGTISNGYYCPLVANVFECEPLNYGNFLYYEEESRNVISYDYLKFNVLVEEYGLDYELYNSYNNSDGIELFNYLKEALKDDTPTKEFVPGEIYYFDYQKLKELLVK